jgi:hypothetical protein
MTQFQEFLYASQLAPDQPTQVVGQIVTRARARNAREGITGLLVFDGMHFWQHLEGPAEAVNALMQRLAADPRHVQMRVVYSGATTQRHYRRFEMGLAQVEDGDGMSVMLELEGSEALAYFLALRPRFDISG